MSQRILTKLKAARASEVCQHFDVKEGVRKYLENGPSPGEFIDLLLADKHYAPAISFMATCAGRSRRGVVGMLVPASCLRFRACPR